MKDESTRYQLLCAAFLAFLVVTAGCMRSQEYEIRGLVTDPPESAYVIPYTDGALQGEQEIKEIVTASIQSYQIENGTPSPRRSADESHEITASEYMNINISITEIDDYSEDGETAIYVNKGEYVVKVWVRQVQLV